MRFLFRERFKRLRIRYIILILVLSIPIKLYVNFQYVQIVTLSNRVSTRKITKSTSNRAFYKSNGI